MSEKLPTLTTLRMELWLKYKNDEGDAKRVSVNSEKFTIGRHSDNDLCIPRNHLSRLHAEIDRYEDAFVLTDADSSNGTKLNGKEVHRPTALSNGDLINFGGGADVLVEINSDVFGSRKSASRKDEETPSSATEKAAEQAETDSVKEAEIVSEVRAADFAPAIAQTSTPKKSGMGMFFIIAPLMVFFVLILGGLVLWLVGGNSKGDISKTQRNDDFIYSDSEYDKPNKNKKDDDSDKTPTPSPTKGNTNSSGTSTSTPDSKNSPDSTPVPISSEKDTVEKNALSFLRRIPNGNASPVLNDKQLNEINQTIKSVKNSSSLKDSLQSIKKNASQIETLAKSKNLRPQFLAAAALAKGGDPLAAAQSMAGDLNALGNQIANESSNESLIIIAAWQDGGSQSKMPSTLATLTKNSSVDARQVRSIWYLHEKGKINDAQYQFALKFLAIGAIMQNPKDFGVQSEAVIFN